jgi:hypothetical protein
MEWVDATRMSKVGHCLCYEADPVSLDAWIDQIYFATMTTTSWYFKHLEPPPGKTPRLPSTDATCRQVEEAFRTYKHTIVERVTPMLKTYALKLTIPMMEGLDAMAIVEWDATGTCFRELD